LRRSNPKLDSLKDGLLRFARNDGVRSTHHPCLREDSGHGAKNAPLPTFNNSNFKQQIRLRYLAAPSARGLPSISRPLNSEGAGNAGRRCARSKNCARSAPRSHRKHPASPRNGLRLMSRSPRRSALLPPSPAGPTAGLTPASRCQDHTSSPSASASPVSRAFASTATHPYVRDVRETPLWSGTGCDRYRLICGFGKSEYFFYRGLTDFG
jgi:hypothetical protein